MKRDRDRVNWDPTRLYPDFPSSSLCYEWHRDESKSWTYIKQAETTETDIHRSQNTHTRTYEVHTWT
jgi:hypothetical protein